MNEKTDSRNSGGGGAFVLTPTAGSVYAFGWRRMKQYFLDLFLIILIVGAVLIPLGMINTLDGHATPGGVLLRIFGFAYWMLLLAPVDFGATWIFLKAARGEKFEVKDMFSTFENYVDVVLAHLLQVAIIGFGLVFFIVPGVVFACRLAFVRYLVTDRKMDPVTAVKESWRMTEGHGGEIFAMGLLTVPIAIAGLVLFGVGIIPAVIWIRASFASMYYAVSGKDRPAPAEAEVSTEGPPAV
jgi:uncharacterized membrane protein